MRAAVDGEEYCLKWCKFSAAGGGMGRIVRRRKSGNIRICLGRVSGERGESSRASE